MPNGAKSTAASSPQRWLQSVTQNSNALDLEHGVFSLRTSAGIARSLKHSADNSKRRKGFSVPIGNVDAELLYQPGGQGAVGSSQETAQRCQG